mgnify:CR=1 FL=1
MIRFPKSLLLLTASSCFLAAPALAQSDARQEPAAPDTAAEPQATAERDPDAAERDPFGTTGPMQDAARRMGSVTGAASATLTLPTIVMRGYVEPADPDKTALALLDIDGVGTTIVRPGDEITLRREQTTLTLRVIEVANGATHIDIQPLKESMIIR